MDSIGKRVQATRKGRGLSQEDLAKAAGVSKQAISQIESGKTKQPSPKTLFAIADCLNVSDRWIIAGVKPAGSKRPDITVECGDKSFDIEVKAHGLTEHEKSVIAAFRMLTPTQQKQAWQSLQDAQQQNLEILQALTQKEKAS